ncbi:bifunctional DNA-binding transcriptional regulator/O6-methylguanine-DNA methyltransferase Ada [Sphingomonas solaris]|uniref:methylated-DNA--[protein]-cysteine S-methyltransferase n=2 Tax=Alterirhizorhabdus solaris TaxID=2529389 RepID=A0A558QRU5_9SPHN|nr:bifunctional DNA-binding transcriptional regulator/O6-methylguanine-DNA methyltransferase Ada [Sphingomonas solaris]TVV69855.1 bifunctional DNA-binding transcriptional regulator/O6-methylguanine-DNA methyltransferase Ada [Sphingomonas solaris]
MQTVRTISPGRTDGTAADPRWPRIVARDPHADGAFWYSVATPGIYCRPACPSRAANPANVTIHDTLADARATGARPCLRCRPDEAPDAVAVAMVARACRAIEMAEEAPDLATLAAAAGLSPAYFHRQFKTHTGLTPRGYAAAHRAGRVRAALAAGATVTQAIHAAGFGSSGRFHAVAGDLLGMAPARYRRGGVAETLRFAVGDCSLGAILVASSERGVAAILLGDDPASLVRELQDRFPAATLVGGDADYETLVAQVIGFVEAPATGLGLPLDIRGTAFQQRVWQALRAIPAGQTASYAVIAQAIGAPQAVRAVAGACAANAHAVAIPCHRVVRTDGALSGYRWGVERKRRLIAREGARPDEPPRR